MRARRRRAETERERHAIEDAWRIHDAQLDWTAKADAKAAFAFGIDSALVATVAVLVSTGKVFVHFDTWYLIAMFVAGAVLLAVAIVFATVGVAPRLRRKRTNATWQQNYIYFGHARHWDPESLERRLRARSLLPQLARQITVTADVAWRKHVNVNWSIWLTVAAGVFLVGYVALVGAARL